MALNIGAINFGVDAQTQGLQKAIAQLQTFQKAVNQVAASQQKGAQAAANALGRQESAIKRAFQQTLNLRRGLQQLGPQAFGELANVSTAFARLTKEMTSGQLSAVEYSRAIDAFNARLNRSSRAMKNMQAEMKAGRQNGLAQWFRELESSAVLAVGPLSGLGSRLRSLGAIAGRTNLSMALLVGTAVGVAVGFGTMGAAALRAATALEKINARFVFSTRSQERAGDEMRFVTSLSKRLGLNILDTAEAYSRLQAAASGTALQGAHTRNIFIGISEAVAAMKLDGQAAEGMFRAIEQMMSKGTVTAEELRGQLGERLLGAFNLAEQAMGTARGELDKMLKSGEITTEEFLPRFVELLHQMSEGLAENNVNSFTGAMNGLKNAAFEFAVEFDRVFGVSDKVIHVIKALTRLITALKGSLRDIAILSAGAAGALVAIAAPSIIMAFGRLIAVIAGAAKVTALFNKALLANPAAAIAKTMLVLAASIGAMAAMDHLIGDIDEELAAVNSEFEKLDRIPGAPNLTDALDRAKEKITEMRFETRALELALQNMQDGYSVGIAEADAEAFKMMNELNPDELAAMTTWMERMGGVGRNLAEQISNVFAAFKTVNDEASAFKSKIDQTPERMREVNEELELADQYLRALQRGPRAIELFQMTEETSRRMEQMRDKLEQTTLTEEQRNDILEQYLGLLNLTAAAQDNLNTLSQTWAQSIASHFEQAIFAGEGLRKVVRSLIQDLAKLAIRQALLEPMAKGISGFFGNIFGGFRAGGGPVSPGKGYIVGEDGPEMIVPRTAGTVIPNGAGGSFTIINQIDARGADPSLITRLPAILEQNNRKLMAQISDLRSRGRLNG
jgi:tape measure domain-containing protein